MKKRMLTVRKMVKRFMVTCMTAALVLGCGNVPVAKAASDTDSETHTLVDMSGKTFQETKFYDESSPANQLFGVAGSFHLFALENIKIGVHCNGNFAAPKVEIGSNYGTQEAAQKGESEVIYFAKDVAPGSLNIRSSHLAIHDSHSITNNQGGNAIVPGSTLPSEVCVDGTKLDIANSTTIYKVDDNFINFSKEFSYLKSLSKTLAAQEPTVSIKSTNPSNPDELMRAELVTTDGVNIVNITADKLNQINDTLTISNVLCNNRNELPGHEFTGTQSVVINVDCKGFNSIDLNCQTYLNCACGAAREIGQGNYYHGSVVIWNFYDSSKDDKVYTGTINENKVVNGCYLAPGASVVTNANTNGTLIAKKITIGGQSHRADFKGLNPIKAEGTFSKTEVTKTSELPGAQLKITSDVSLEGVTKKSGPNITYSGDKKTISWTSENQPLVLTQLPAGTYTMTEITAPQGYEVAESISFTVNGTKLYDEVGNEITANKIVMEDAPTPGPTPPEKAEGTFSKTEVTKTSELPGAQLKITADVSLAGVSKKSGPDITLSGDNKTISWTSGGNPLVLTNLPAGTYTMTEATAPDGYEVAESIKFKVNGTKLYSMDNSEMAGNKIVMEDAPTPGPIPPEKARGTFSKTAVASTVELPGAQLKITSDVSLAGVSRESGPNITFSGDNKTISWTSGENPLVLTQLPAGTYTMTEITAPDGYEKAESIKFKVNGTTLYKVDNSEITDNKIVMEDAPKPAPEPYEKARGTFSKTAVASTTELSGARLQITANVSLKLVTKESGPEISYNADENTISWTSGENPLVLAQLPAGTYTMTEITAPHGYEVAESISFTVNGTNLCKEDGSVISGNKIVMKDAPTGNPGGSTDNPGGSIDNPGGSTDNPGGSTDNPGGSTDNSGSTSEKENESLEETGDFVITITDDKTKEPVPDAEVEITKPDGSTETYTTDIDGTVTIPEAAPGTYTARVIKVPTGYTVDLNKTITVIVKAKKKGDEKNKQDIENARKALKKAANIKTGSNALENEIVADETITKREAKNTKRINAKMSSKLKKYKKNHKKQSKEVAAWIEISGTRINYPVMYTGLKNNTKYLHKNINGKKDTHGMLFFSYATPKRKMNYNNVIYGHNMKDKTMFADLNKYASKSFYKKHKYVKIYTEGYNYVYEVVDVFRLSCAKGSSERKLYEQFGNFDKKSVFKKWKKQVTKMHEYKCSSSYKNTDNLMMLSTCEYTKENGRLIVLCKQVKCEKVK